MKIEYKEMFYDVVNVDFIIQKAESIKALYDGSEESKRYEKTNRKIKFGDFIYDVYEQLNRTYFYYKDVLVVDEIPRYFYNEPYKYGDPIKKYTYTIFITMKNGTYGQKRLCLVNESYNISSLESLNTILDELSKFIPLKRCVVQYTDLFSTIFENSIDFTKSKICFPPHSYYTHSVPNFGFITLPESIKDSININNKSLSTILLKDDITEKKAYTPVAFKSMLFNTIIQIFMESNGTIDYNKDVEFSASQQSLLFGLFHKIIQDHKNRNIDIKTLCLNKFGYTKLAKDLFEYASNYNDMSSFMLNAFSYDFIINEVDMFDYLVTSKSYENGYLEGLINNKYNELKEKKNFSKINKNRALKSFSTQTYNRIYGSENKKSNKLVDSMVDIIKNSSYLAPNLNALGFFLSAFDHEEFKKLNLDHLVNLIASSFVYSESYDLSTDTSLVKIIGTDNKNMQYLSLLVIKEIVDNKQFRIQPKVRFILNNGKRSGTFLTYFVRALNEYINLEDSPRRAVDAIVAVQMEEMI